MPGTRRSDTFVANWPDVGWARSVPRTALLNAPGISSWGPRCGPERIVARRMIGHYG